MSYHYCYRPPRRPSILKAAVRAVASDVERALIGAALEAFHWNRAKAARELGISYKSLITKIAWYGLRPTVALTYADEPPASAEMPSVGYQVTSA